MTVGLINVTVGDIGLAVRNNLITSLSNLQLIQVYRSLWLTFLELNPLEEQFLDRERKH